MSKIIKMENWSLVMYGGGQLSPEDRGLHIHGNLYNHPCQEDSIFEQGKEKTTSRIVDRNNDIIITRTGTKYHLGIVDPEYDKLFPDALSRLLIAIDRSKE